MHRLLRLACATLLVIASSLAEAAGVAATDFSERLDALWNFEQPTASEARFRAEAPQHRAWSREAVETATQLARALGLQRRFAEANKILDTIEPSLPRLPARVRVRYLLERGRCENSSGRPAAAFGWFEQALAASAQDDLPGAARRERAGRRDPPNHRPFWRSL